MILTKKEAEEVKEFIRKHRAGLIKNLRKNYGLKELTEGKVNGTLLSGTQDRVF